MDFLHRPLTTPSHTLRPSAFVTSAKKPSPPPRQSVTLSLCHVPTALKFTSALTRLTRLWAHEVRAYLQSSERDLLHCRQQVPNKCLWGDYTGYSPGTPFPHAPALTEQLSSSQRPRINPAPRRAPSTSPGTKRAHCPSESPAPQSLSLGRVPTPDG